ncbi:transcription factor kayak [Cyclopterus lumpus]|uniref:transcription factor kayak n=1 Tax=Cyclopterus lumpus TaxID=8103 RepID=UPI0014868F7D|nr:transcription factor kayak [Cyclopterus lumpus]
MPDAKLRDSEDTRHAAGVHVDRAVFERSPGAAEAHARQSCCRGARAMSPLFMDTGCELNSPGSVSAEESNTAGWEREDGGEHTGRRGRIKQERNKNAARKSRRKQTERADELHEELQCLERSNLAIKKEIAALKKDLHFYTAALERHEPSCRLKDSTASSSTSRLSVSSSAAPPRDRPGASRSAFPAAPSLSTSLTSSLGLQPGDCLKSTHFSSLTPLATTSADLPRGSSADLFTSSSSVTAPVSFSAVPTPCSLFSADSPSLIALRPTNVPPVCTGLVSHSAPSRSGAVRGNSSASANAHFSALHPGVLDEFLMTQASFIPVSSNVVPFNSHLVAENAGLDCPVSLPRSLLPPALQDPCPESLSMSYPAPAFALKPTYSQQVTLNRSSLLSMLSVPSPPNVSQTTSGSFDEPVPQPPPSPPLLRDPLRDVSLCKLLEGNDWILSGTDHQ